MLDVNWLDRFNSAHGICIILVNLGGATKLRLEPAKEKGMRKYLPKLTPGIDPPQISYRMNESFLADTESDVSVLAPQTSLSEKVQEIKIVISTRICPREIVLVDDYPALAHDTDNLDLLNQQCTLGPDTVKATQLAR